MAEEGRQERDALPPPQPELPPGQLQVYAQEMHQLYLRERELRRELERERDSLAQKVRELTALNTLAQQAISRQLKTAEDYEALVGEVKGLLAQVETLKRRIKPGE